MIGLVHICLAALVWLGPLVLAAPAAHAQDDPAGASYITPFPEGDIYKLQVVGDALADGALGGLVEALGSDSRLQINRKHRHLSGITRPEADDEIKAIDDTPPREHSHITVVLVGRDDRNAIRLTGNRRLAVGSAEWREEYGRRVDRLMKALKRRGGAIYWIGLPVVQRGDWNETVQLINDLVRDRAHINGIKYIDAYAGLADENGSFVALGPDVAGLVRRLRESDGIGFTPAGNRKLAHFVEREIRRDLTQAKADRTIPLAGAEVEQRKINPEKVEPRAPAPLPPRAADAGRAGWQTAMVPPPAPPAAGGAGEQKADNSRIALRTMTPTGREETVAIDILRPAIPASVIQLMARNSAPEKATQVGDTLVETLPGGLLLLSSVSPSGEGAGPGRRSKLAPTQTPYFRVMVKGEQMPAKAGRADDFRWPRPDQQPEPAAAAPAPAPAAAAATAPAAVTTRPGAKATAPRP